MFSSRMTLMSQSAPPQSSEQDVADASAATNAAEDSSDSHNGEELQNAQILAHAKSVATPPATPSLTEWIEMDITSSDIREYKYSPRLYLARLEIQPPCLTIQEIDGIKDRLRVDLTSAYKKIGDKTLRKPWAQSIVTFDMRMSGVLKRGSTRLRLRPSIWIFCASKWCEKIVQNDVKCLGWLRPYDIHFIRKGGPLLSAGKGKDRDSDYAESLASLSLSDHHDYVPRDDTSITRYPGDRSDFSTYDEIYSLGSHTGYSPAPLPPASGGAASYVAMYQPNTYTYPYATASASDYATDYPRYEYDAASIAASIASSSAPSAYAGRSSGMWSGAPSVGTAATSAPSMRSNVTDVNNTIHRQAPPNERYELPCEFSNLTSCSRVFHGDEEVDWVKHHTEEHLREKLPFKLRCWFCSEYIFDAKETFNGDVGANFIARMQHIRGHIVDDGYRFEQMQKDGHLVKHLLSHGLIDRSTYDGIVSPDLGMPARPSGPFRHRSHRAHWAHLSQVEEDVVVTSSSNGRRTIRRFARADGKHALILSRSSTAESKEVSHGCADPSPHSEALSETGPVPDARSQSGIKLSGGTELHVHVGSQWITSLIGLSCVSSIQKANAEVSRSHSKMGGAVAITRGRKTLLYGVTSGHGVIRQVIERASGAIDNSCSMVESSESSDSESEDDINISYDVSKADSGLANKTPNVFPVDLSDRAVWTNITHDLTAGFCGMNFPSDSQIQLQQIPRGWHINDCLSGDLALFPLGFMKPRGLKNYYIDGGTQVAKELAYISEEEVQCALPVAVLLGPEQTANGTLLPGKFYFSMCGTPVETTRVRLSKDLAMGSSGSWVVNGRTLYGMIVAVYPNECLALMVPARKMLSDIRAMFPDATKISVDLRA